MSEDSLKSMKRAIGTHAHHDHFHRRWCRINICLTDKNISTKGMCPLSVKYPNLEGANPGSKEIDHRLKIKPGQVITTVSCHCILDVRHYPDPWITTHYRFTRRDLMASEFLCVGQARGTWRLWWYSTDLPVTREKWSLRPCSQNLAVLRLRVSPRTSGARGG